MDQHDQPAKKRGGARPGAGRPTRYAETKVIRIPSQYQAAIVALIKHLDETQMINQDYRAVTSEPMFMRSLSDQAQQINFTTAPFKSRE
jgi:hypothetical protein